MLEGEDPRTKDPDDARHWHAVYEQLIDFTLRQVDQQPADRPALEERLGRYGGRVTFWRERGWELEEVRIDEQRRRVSHWSGTLALTSREFQILRLMLANPGRSYSSRRLLREAWHDPALPEEALRGYIGRLRRKLLTVNLASILTDVGEGYRLVMHTASATSAEEALAG
ncbi:MAG TPA: winged helix-turn-helix domain-containing protein [Candidatus Dormibacteraeota bacterium]|nr:winged helix-turn-helix domain-containing protein [Candidatus Dormibacteraeota bacterium]